MDVEQRRKWLWVLAVAVFLVASGVVGWKLGLPAYRRHKEVRALAQAKEYLQKGDYRSGALALRQVLVLNAGNLEAVRLMADVMFSAGSPEALAWWRRVVELDPSPQHKLRYAATAMRVEKRPFPIASQIVEELAPISATNLPFQLIAAQLALETGLLEKAETHLQTAARLDPTNRLYQLNLATVRLKSQDATVAETARREILALASDAAVGSVALRSLTAEALQRDSLAEAEGFSKRLLALPQATYQDRLQHLSVLKKAASSELPSSLEQAKQAAGTNVISVSQLLTWLNANDLSRETLTWVATLAPNTRSAFPVPLMEAQGYLNLKDWAGLESYLAGQHWQEENEFMRLALLTRALREQGRREMAEANWRRAMAAANARVGTLVTLLQLTAAWNWSDEKEAILWAIVKRAPREDWAWNSLLQTCNATGNTEGVYRVYSALLERNPDSDALRNNVASVLLLLNRDVERAADLARKAYESNKTNTAIVSTHAFALFRQGKTQEGLQVFQSLPESSLRQPDIALYYAVLLNAAGQRDKAAPYVELAEKGRMLPEEKQLLTAARIK